MYVVGSIGLLRSLSFYDSPSTNLPPYLLYITITKQVKIESIMADAIVIQTQFLNLGTSDQTPVLSANFYRNFPTSTHTSTSRVRVWNQLDLSHWPTNHTQMKDESHEQSIASVSWSHC